MPESRVKLNLDIQKRAYCHTKGILFIIVSNNLFCDHDGHIRRAWNVGDMRAIAAKLGYDLEEIGHTKETWEGQKTHFINLIAAQRA